jgi:Domain of unknown function (DUF932)
MAHEWHRGVLTASSWHGLEEVGVMADEASMIAHGERSGAWPVSLRFDEVRTAGGLVAPGRAIVASYQSHPEACLSVVGDRYRATSTEEWRTLVKAATAAGARPTGSFALRGGSRVLATFEVGQSNGLRTQLVLADAFDGSMRLTCGFSSIRVVCANTLSAAMSSDGQGMAQLRHTASLETKVNVLAESIATAVKSGDKVREAYHQAEATKLSRHQAENIFDKLFPCAPEGADRAAVTKSENVRADGRRAMSRDENYAGCSLATLWNAATWLVDRTPSGQARPTRGGDPLDSLLFGSRGDRVSEIQTIVELVMRDGTVQSVPASEALKTGVDPLSVGRKVLEDMLRDADAAYSGG